MPARNLVPKSVDRSLRPQSLHPCNAHLVVRDQIGQKKGREVGQEGGVLSRARRGAIYGNCRLAATFFGLVKRGCWDFEWPVGGRGGSVSIQPKETHGPGWELLLNCHLGRGGRPDRTPPPLTWPLLLVTLRITNFGIGNPI